MGSCNWYLLPMKMKAVLLSSGLVWAAFMVKLSAPLLMEFLTSELPLLCSSSWLQPPYLYLLINCIILSIVASSKLNQPAHAHSQEVFCFPDADEKSALNQCQEDARNQPAHAQTDADEFVISSSMWTPPKRQPLEHSPVSSAEKPPVSARFSHRKPVKASPEGKTVLKVSRPKRQETLESTWRTITEGRAMPLKRHQRKSDASPVRVMRKSETFSGGNSSPGSGGRLRSLSQDELNRRVEAFIKKFNDEMRLQRQESLNHYREMVARRAGSGAGARARAH